MSIEIAPLVDPVYARTLAIICCRSFYGEHKPMDSVNIFASLQRALLFEEIVGDLSRRLVRYQSMSRTSDLGCGRVLTAVDDEGTLVGFLDLSLTLYDTVGNEFLVSEGPGLTLPRPGMERRAYIANVAVSTEARRKGVAEKLMRQAEALALKWVDCDELWLEVSESNLAAVSLYKKLGYEVKLLDPESKEVVRGPLGYSMEISPRLRFAKKLQRAGGGGEQAETESEDRKSVV